MKYFAVLLKGIAALAGVMCLVVAVYLIRNSVKSSATEEAYAAMQSSVTVVVEDGDMIVYRPKSQQTKAGLFFYPGGGSDPVSYSVPMQAIAEQGYLVIVPRVPFRLPLLDTDAMREAMRLYSEVEVWIAGGHSLGGVVAAKFVVDNDDVAGLILWASYPGEAFGSLAEHEYLKILQITASEDEEATPEKVAAHAHLLPENARVVDIKGGCHQFGHADTLPCVTLSIEEQQQEAIAATLELLNAVVDEDPLSQKKLVQSETTT